MTTDIDLDQLEATATADYLDHAARNLEGGYPLGGYNVTHSVIRLLHDVAIALRAAHGSTDPAHADGSAS